MGGKTKMQNEDDNRNIIKPLIREDNCFEEDENEMSENYIKKSLDNIILNLKIIAKIKPGLKLSIKENNLYIDNSYFQYIFRTLVGDSREKTIKFLDNLDKSINFRLEEIIKNTDENIFLNSNENILLDLCYNLNLSLVGLNNLKNTYNSDQFTVSKIEMLVVNFELKCRKISSILKIKEI